jgi:hypothetical protein
MRLRVEDRHELDEGTTSVFGGTPMQGATRDDGEEATNQCIGLSLIKN